MVLENILQTHFSSDEFEKIRQKYVNGELKEEEQDFEEYLAKNKESILEHRPWMDVMSKRGGFDIVTIVQLYIILEAKGSLNASHEAKRQLNEMDREAYFISEKYGSDQKNNMNAIAMEWAKKHAAGWRDHERNIYCVLAGIKSGFCKKILEPLQTPPPQNNYPGPQATA